MNIPEASSKRGFDWGLSLGFDYVTGAKCSLLSTSVSCTSSGTTAISVPVAVMAQLNRLRVEVTVPFVDIEGPGTLGGTFGTQQITAQSGGTVKRRSGLGDVSLGGAFILLREGRILPRFELAGVVKLPSAASGLGTGKTDYGAQVTFYRPLLTGITTFGSVGYQWVADTNTVKFHSGERATLGLDVDYGIIGGGALLDYRKSLFAGSPNTFTVDPFVTLRVFGRLGVQAYTTIALTRSSPGREVGIRLVL